MNTDISKRTKGEWSVSNFLNECSIYCASQKKGIAKMPYHIFDYKEEEVEANAAFICLAVNNHDKLIEALEDCIADLDCFRWEDKKINRVGKSTIQVVEKSRKLLHSLE